MQTDVRITDYTATVVSDFLGERGYAAPLIVSDPNTHRAAGDRLASSLSALGIAVEEFVLARERPAADAEAVGDVLIGLERTPDVVIGVGGGTVTDIARLVAHRMDRPLASYPTAPSVDAYASPTSAMTFRGVKKTVPARAAEVVFANTEVLAASPHDMIAAGFGDMVAKLTSTPDWELAAVVAGEGFDEDIATRSVRAAESCAAQVDLIHAHEAAGLTTLLGGLIDSGDCMRDWGGSRPASGSEHLLSHFWEMRAARAGKPSALHGGKVAVGTLVIAGLFERLAGVGASELERRVAAAKKPDAATLREVATRGFGATSAETLLEGHFFATMSEERFTELARNAGGAAERIIEIATSAPSSDRVRDLMRRADGPTHPREIDLSPDDVRDALASGQFIRNRFGLLVFWHLFSLGRLDDLVEEVFG
jgi:glycerol-1-phosphate dehydrogenase [NAD(P)+]